MNRHPPHKPPFPYFGGKSPVADVVWAALGDVPNYVEPFAGSAAVLLLRPQVGHIETINDADGFVANFWRAMSRDPVAVAEHADNPVNECDLHARHLWLIGERDRITDRLAGDADFFDAKAAGWWCWGLCCWIGSGWCSGSGPWQSVDGAMALGNPGQGVNRQLPHLGDPGRGVNRQRPHLGDPGRGERAARREWLIGYLQGFADRLRNVRVCCGDWKRVCGPAVTFRHGITGVFLDPPYADTAKRTAKLYATDCEQVAHDVRRWAIEQGDNPKMRIVLAGYEGEHVMPPLWRKHEWKTAGGYANISPDEEQLGRANRGKERLWFSPACIPLAAETRTGIFEEVA